MRLIDHGDVLTVQELEEVLRVSRHTAYGVAKAIGVRLGKRIIVPRLAVEKLLASSIYSGGWDETLDVSELDVLR